jgi:hypothetical protein
MRFFAPERSPPVPRYLIERNFGHVTEEQLQEGGSTSKRVASEQFPEIIWEHSHAIMTSDGLRTMCVYGAPTEQYVRDHAAAAGLPCDNIQEIADTVGPADFK